MNAPADTNPAVLHLVGVTIEAVTPVSAASGDFVRIERAITKDGKKKIDTPLEVALVRDASGLPTVPGASLQGVLRGLYQDAFGEAAAKDGFGYVKDASSVRAGRVVVGFGALHDSNDRALVGLITRDQLNDDLIKALKDTVGPAPDNTSRGNEQRVGNNKIPHGRMPVRRDHVKLNERHVADGKAKFGRLAVPAGTRFSFEIAMWGGKDPGVRVRRDGSKEDVPGAKKDKETLAAIVDLINHPAFRLGGAARRGYGKVRLVRASYQQVTFSDLHTEEGRRKHRELRRKPPSTPLAERWYSDGKPDKDHPHKDWVTARPARGVVMLTLTLTLLNPWRIGGVGTGNELVLTEGTTLGIRLPNGDAPASDFGADPRRGEKGIRTDVQTAVREPLIRWTRSPDGDKDTGKLVKLLAMENTASARNPFDDNPHTEHSLSFIVPGSALKGPLAHRTLYHWNRLQPNDVGLIDAGALDSLHGDALKQKLEELKKKVANLKNRPRDLEDLFGAAKEANDKEAEQSEKKGRAARILIDEATVTGVRAVQAIDHVSIDRFTGGTRTGALYVEEVLVGGEIKATLAILPPLDDVAGENGKYTVKPGSWEEDGRALVIKAFCAALADLCQGRLAIGAKSLGFCEGTVTWGGDKTAAAPWQAAWQSATQRRHGGAGGEAAA